MLKDDRNDVRGSKDDERYEQIRNSNIEIRNKFKIPMFKFSKYYAYALMSRCFGRMFRFLFRYPASLKLRRTGLRKTGRSLLRPKKRSPRCPAREGLRRAGRMTGGRVKARNSKNKIQNNIENQITKCSKRDLKAGFGAKQMPASNFVGVFNLLSNLLNCTDKAAK